MKQALTCAAVLAAAATHSVAQLAGDQTGLSNGRHRIGVQVPVFLRAQLSMRGGGVLYRSGGITGDPEIDGRQERFYEDGFVRMNSLGNPTVALTGPLDAFPRTTYFSFVSNSQIIEPKFGADSVTPGHLSLHEIEVSSGEYTIPFENEPRPSLEFFYRYRWLDRPQWSLDLEVGLSWLHLEWDQSATLGAVTRVYEDRYNTGTVNPRVNEASGGTLPYAGFFEPVGGAPWIGSSPDRQPVYTKPASVQSQRELTYDAAVVRLGPAVEWRPIDRLQIGLLPGLAAGLSRAEFSFTDRITVNSPSIPNITQAGKGDFTDSWVGLYSAVRIAWQLSDRWDVLVEARHLWLPDQEHTESQRNMTIGMSEGFGISGGISWRF